MKKPLSNCLFVTIFAACLCLMTSCSDKDEPDCPDKPEEPGLIDTSKVKITADVSITPYHTWYMVDDYITVDIKNFKVDVPEGVLLRTIDLMSDGEIIAQKPYSGNDITFKMPLKKFGISRVNFTIIGNLVKKDVDEAQVIISDNLSIAIFSQRPEIDVSIIVDVTVKGKSTSGEELNRNFKVKSNEKGRRVNIPQSELYWIPNEGTADRIDVTMSVSGDAYSPNSTLECKFRNHWWYSQTDYEMPTSNSPLTLNIKNVPGSLDQFMLTVGTRTGWYGTFEGIWAGSGDQTDFFAIRESE